MYNTWVVDQIDEKVAALENTATLEIQHILISNLPKNIKPGDTLVKTDNTWQKSTKETTARKVRIDKLFARIKTR